MHLSDTNDTVQIEKQESKYLIVESLLIHFDF